MTYIDETDYYLFLQGYREAMLWANTLEYGGDGVADDELGPSLNAYTDGVAWIAYAAWAEAEAECRAFLETVVEEGILPLYGDGSIQWPYTGAHSLEWTSAELAGHDFALTRNGHGAGFWDRGLGEVGDKLTKLAYSYGEANWVLENGRIDSL